MDGPERYSKNEYHAKATLSFSDFANSSSDLFLEVSAQCLYQICLGEKASTPVSRIFGHG